MHELSIVESVLTAALKNTPAGQRITRIGMRIGVLTNVVPEALEFAFEVATKDTLAAGAVLDVDYIPVGCRCERCQTEFEVADFNYLCPGCQSSSGALIRGNELQLSFIEVEEDGTAADDHRN